MAVNQCGCLTHLMGASRRLAIVLTSPLRRLNLPLSGLPAPSKHLPATQWAVLIVVAAWAAAFEVWRFIGIVVFQPGNTDYRLYYLAAQAGARWGWENMYDPSRLQLLNGALATAGSQDISRLYTYLNPPLIAWLIALAAPLPYAVGLCLWTALNIAAMIVACRVVFARSRSVWIAVLLASIAVWPTAFAIERGQPELLLYSLVVGSWWCAERGSERWAGVLLGLAGCLKPQSLVLLPAVFLICGFRRTALWWLTTSVGALAVFAFVLGPTGIGTYLGVTAWSASDPSFTSSPFLSPFGSRFSLLVGQGVFATATLAGAWLNRRSLRLALAIGIVGTLTSAIHLHEYDYVGLVVAAWLATDQSVSVLEVGWLAIGLICAQLPAIGIRSPILIWQPIWLVFLCLRDSLRRALLKADYPAPLPDPA